MDPTLERLFQCYTDEENRLYRSMAEAWTAVEMKGARDIDTLRAVAPRCRQLVEGTRRPTLAGDAAALAVAQKDRHGK